MPDAVAWLEGLDKGVAKLLTEGEANLVALALTEGVTLAEDDDVGLDEPDATADLLGLGLTEMEEVEEGVVLAMVEGELELDADASGGLTWLVGLVEAVREPAIGDGLDVGLPEGEPGLLGLGLGLVLTEAVAEADDVTLAAEVGVAAVVPVGDVEGVAATVEEGVGGTREGDVVDKADGDAVAVGEDDREADGREVELEDTVGEDEGIIEEEADGEAVCEDDGAVESWEVGLADAVIVWETLSSFGWQRAWAKPQPAKKMAMGRATLMEKLSTREMEAWTRKALVQTRSTMMVTLEQPGKKKVTSPMMALENQAPAEWATESTR